MTPCTASSRFFCPFTIFAHVYPTLLKAERQQVMGQWCENDKKGYGLGIDPSGRLAFWVGDGEVIDQIVAETPMVARCWYFVAAGFSAASASAPGLSASGGVFRCPGLPASRGLPLPPGHSPCGGLPSAARFGACGFGGLAP